MSETALEVMIKETRHAFIIAKSDGILDVSEVIKIASDLIPKLRALALPGPETKAMLLHTLKKALDASGGVENLAGFSEASSYIKEAFEEHILNAAGVVVDIMSASDKLNFKTPSWFNWSALVARLPSCFKVKAEAALAATDATLVSDAVKFSEKLVMRSSESVVTAIAEAVPVVEAAVAAVVAPVVAPVKVAVEAALAPVTAVEAALAPVTAVAAVAPVTAVAAVAPVTAVAAVEEVPGAASN